MFKMLGKLAVLALALEGLFSFPRNLRTARRIWPDVVEQRTGERSLIRYVKNNW